MKHLGVFLLIAFFVAGCGLTEEEKRACAERASRSQSSFLKTKEKYNDCKKTIRKFLKDRRKKEKESAKKWEKQKTWNKCMHPYRIEANKQYEEDMAKVRSMKINNDKEYIARQKKYGGWSDREWRDYELTMAKAGKHGAMMEATTACSHLLD